MCFGCIFNDSSRLVTKVVDVLGMKNVRPDSEIGLEIERWLDAPLLPLNFKKHSRGGSPMRSTTRTGPDLAFAPNPTSSRPLPIG